jgi:tRNA(Ile)-lysidine synthase
MAWWMRHRPENRLEAVVVEGLLHGFSEAGKKTSFSIGANQVLVLDPNGALQVRPEHLAIPGDWPAGASWYWPAGPLFLPDGSWLSAAVFEWSKGPAPAYQNADPATEAWIAGWDPSFQIRQWQAGDRYRPLGAPGRRKLQDLFTDAKISPEQKRALPVLLNDQQEILWVPGFPPSEGGRITPQGISALKLTYHMQ